jgi:hypothetical protein
VFGGVPVTVTGAVGDVEGYPPLPADLRGQLAASTWSFPGDLPLSELESRLAERLRTEYDLSAVSVHVDSRGRASVSAAPPMSGLSRRVPNGRRAVSVPALLPTGVARGDEVVATTADVSVRATVLSARTTDDDPPDSRSSTVPSGGDVATDGGMDAVAAAGTSTAVAPTTSGGEGRVTLAVDRSRATALLRADRARVRVCSRGTHREFEVVSLLRRAGNRFRRVTVRAGGALDGTTIGAASVRDAYGVAVLGVRLSSDDSKSNRSAGESRWRFSPDGDVALSAGDELFVVGRPDALDAFVEGVA